PLHTLLWPIRSRLLESSLCIFFFSDTSTTEIYTLSLHDALPILVDALWMGLVSIPAGHQLPSFGPLYDPDRAPYAYDPDEARRLDRKSTRLNSSHVKISYAVFCLKKKKK